MEEYEFTSKWIRDNNPPTATRCLVTDGELVLIATYVTDNTHSHWVFSGLDDSQKFDVIGWMELPKPIKRAIPYVEPS